MSSHSRYCTAIAVVVALSAQADADQRKPAPAQLPPAMLSVWLDGFHMRDGHASEQHDVHHFCVAPAKGPIQCALFDGYDANARLIGIEYIIDEKTFASLPAAERKLWHSHVYEVTSGALVAPGMTEAEETEFFKTAISTYGKTWHTWDMSANASVPVGRPQLMMAFTKDGVLKSDSVQRRDRQLGTNTAKLRARRAKAITSVPKIVSGADTGEGGKSCLPNEPEKPASQASMR